MKHLIAKLNRIPDDFFLDPPHTIHFNITYRCNRRCAYCNVRQMVGQLHGTYEQSASLELKTSTIKRLLDEASEIGVRLVNISGGEPFIRKDIYDVIQYGVSRGLSLFPLTKYAFTQHEALRLRDAGVNKIGVSFDSFMNQTNEKLHGNHTIKTDLVQTVNNLLQVGIDPIIAPVICSLNYHQYEGLVKRFQRMGVNAFTPMVIAGSLLATRRGLKPVDGLLLLTRAKMIKLRTKIAEIHEKYGVEDSVPFIPRKLDQACPSVDHAHISPDGFLTYCSSTADLYYGSVKRRSLMDVWLSKRRIQLMQPSRKQFKGTRCFACPKFDLCNKLGRCYFEYLRHPPFFRPEEQRLCKKVLS
jgi:radical SAM protein with 4Fe4S-binding SPASM domain